TPSSTVSSFTIAESNGLLTAYFPHGMFSKVFTSTDWGQSWEQRVAPPYAFSDVYFETKENGSAVRYRSGAFFAYLQVMRYDSAKNYWTLVEEAPRECVRPLRDLTRTQFFCVTKGGSILAPTDGKWRAEFRTE